MHPFPLPQACTPASFDPVYSELSDSLADESASFYLPSAPQGLVATFTSAALPSVVTLDLVADVASSGRLRAAALGRLRAAAGDGSRPWWIVVHNLSGVDTPARVVNGGNLLMLLLDRQYTFEGAVLRNSATLLLSSSATDKSTLQSSWEGLASAVPVARGQTKLNPVALFNRISKSGFPALGAGSTDWAGALNSKACRAALGGGSGSSSSSSSAGSWMFSLLHSALTYAFYLALSVGAVCLVLLVFLIFYFRQQEAGSKAAALPARQTVAKQQQKQQQQQQQQQPPPKEVKTVSPPIASARLRPRSVSSNRPK